MSQRRRPPHPPQRVCVFRLAAALGIGFALASTLETRAGDILRGGVPSAVTPGRASGGVNTAPTLRARDNAKDTLARTTEALKAVQAMQAAARGAAVGPVQLGLDPNHPGKTLPTVSNGLTRGGLVVAPGVPVNLSTPAVGEDRSLWKGAKLPTQTTSNGETLVNIQQTKQQAVLNWATFNVGKDTELVFDQSAGGADRSQWIAFNKINDPTGVPSQILGSIRADGQVYLINANGILFGGSSSVNLHALVASSLPINDNLLKRGLLNNPDAQFLFSSLPIEAGTNGTPAFMPPAAFTPSGLSGDVIVQPGATLTSPTTADHVGGKIALVGANVKNGGTISTPDGQTILAAGAQVGLVSHDVDDPSLRGLDVYVGAVSKDDGVAVNSGVISAPRANVTIAGKTIKQLGAIDSSTSVALNGRVDLLASYDAVSSGGLPDLPPFLQSTTGTVIFGDGSVTRILPELSSTETVVGTRLALASQMNVMGRAIHLAADATILAPSAKVSLSAGNWEFSIATGTPQTRFVYDDGQIYLDSGATIDVSGSADIAAPISQNIVTLQFRGAELADSPLQRTGPLRGPDVQIDLRKTGTFNGRTWIGTPLADASGYVGLIEHTVGELTTDGGTVSLSAGASIVMQRGSTLDVSGGSINFEGGLVQTTRVVSGGQIFDIAQATPDRVYDGIFTGKFTATHAKWGLNDTFTNPLVLSGAHYEEGYTQGKNGGSVALRAPSMALDGSLRGNTLDDPRPRTSTPLGSTLSLTFQGRDAVAPYVLNLLVPPAPPRVTFSSSDSTNAAATFAVDTDGNPLPLRADRRAEVTLSPTLLTTGGFTTLKIDNSRGDISIPAEIALTTLPGGSITMSAANLSIAGKVTARAGSLAFTVYDYSPYIFGLLGAFPDVRTPDADPNNGHFALAASATLSTAGLVVDDRLTAAAPQSLPPFTNGGSISIVSYSADLALGSTIDVSGGVAVNAAGKRTYGNGGSIVIKAGQDASIASVLGGELRLGSTLIGFAGGKGGSVAIQAPRIKIGGTSTNEDILLIAPDWFNQGGFVNFALTGLGVHRKGSDEDLPGLIITPETVIAPVAQSLIDVSESIGSRDVLLAPTLLPDALRTPVSLSFAASGVKDTFTGLPAVRGDLIMREGAVIRTEPKASVALGGDTVAVLGSVIAPGGAITISGAKSFPSITPTTRPLLTVDLGSHSLLSTVGTTVLSIDPRGFRTGAVLPGGSISISGNIAAEAGAVLDVSGASDVLDVQPGFAFVNDPKNTSLIGAPFVSTRIDSSAGTITLTGGQALFSDATLRGFAGGPSAQGGNLVVSSGRFYPVGSDAPTPLDVTIGVTQSGQSIPTALHPDDETGIGKAVRDGDGKVLPGRGYFAAESFNAGGFGALTIKGTVKFSGPVVINAPRSVSIASGGVLFGDDAVYLNAPYVALGTPFQAPVAADSILPPFTVGNQPFNFSPTFGAGHLTVNAGLIDIGNLSLQNIGRADFIADGGDIRGDGTLNVAGEIFIRAGQLYPPTAVTFTVAASDYQDEGKTQRGSVTIVASGSRQLPLSAGGVLNVFGSRIEQGGVLRVPIGTINLGWDGTGTAPVNPITGQAVAVTRILTLAPGSITSVSAVDPATGQSLIIPYGINLNGTAWIDPTGTDITSGGVPGKMVHIAAVNVADQVGSSIDIRGGGDLFAYRFIKGIGGTTDILASSSSFAVMPGYEAEFAPFAPFNTAPATSNLGSDPGYVSTSVSVGDRVYLGQSDGLRAGFYTLFPARYALLPGAFLVTPQSAAPVGGLVLPDGSSLVSGYRFNALNAPQSQPQLARFEVAPGSIVRARSEYAEFSANAYLRDAALDHDLTPPRLPVDSGQLVLEATKSMSLQGSVASRAPDGGRGGLVDISSPVDILIAAPGTAAVEGKLVLDAAQLSGFGAESLLIGGIRKSDATGTSVTVQTTNLTVDNAGSVLSGPDLILVASRSLALAPGASIEGSGALASEAETLRLGDPAVAGSGDGTLLRVSSDPGASIVRSGVDASTVPHMVVGSGARVSGGAIILDSTYATSLDPNAILTAQSITLDSGRISIVLENAGAGPGGEGLVLAGVALQNLQSAQRLSLLSYSSIDVYGTGQFGGSGVVSLGLHASKIRGFNSTGGTATFVAQDITLDGPFAAVSTLASTIAPPATLGSLSTPALALLAPGGTLAFNAATLHLGANQLRVSQYGSLILSATGGIIGEGTGGLKTQGDLAITAPAIVGATGATQTIEARGALTISAPFGGIAGSLASGLGARFTFIGSSVTDTAPILLPSGSLTLRATAGDILLGAALDVSGTAQTFHDLVKYTDGGEVSLIADVGSVLIAQGGALNVSAQSEGGSAGRVSIAAPKGALNLGGTLLGPGGAFDLDVGSLPSLAAINAALDAAAFTKSRIFRIRTGDVLVDGFATAQNFDLSADRGAITVTGTIDASGPTGGNIVLAASGEVALASGSRLSVAGLDFNHAGKGGSVSIETRGVGGASIEIRNGSTIDLSIAAAVAPGQFTGTLHLRAPQSAGNSDLQVGAFNGTIVNASLITIEGYEIFDLTSTGGAIDAAVRDAVKANGIVFVGDSGAASPGYVAMHDRLLLNNAGLDSVVSIVPGAELINTAGDLTLGSTNSTATSDWDLSTFRFGPKGAPGVLTMRASGNLVFFNTLSDGFASSAYDAPLLAQNTALAANAQSWTYRLVAGADFSAADFHRVEADLPADTGSLLLGKNNGINIANPFGPNALTSRAIKGFYQVIRTGSGDIDIAAGRDVQLLNHFATIYTAGTQISDPTVLPGGAFDLPILSEFDGQSVLGAIQHRSPYPVAYTLAGGNVTLHAGGDIAHLTQDSSGALIPDSERQLPNNWLYRRGYVDPATGLFGIARFGDVASTTWWVDFSNFFEGIAALGGGNVTLNAGRDIANVDALIPTNARMPKGAPDQAKLLELGGGDLVIRAGRDIDGGVYYVERGTGTLAAGNRIHTNATRSPSLGTITVPSTVFSNKTWLPTTLFLGKGSFDVSARGDLLLGPVANPFLLPGGYSNTFWYKTYFSTYAASDTVDVASLTGRVGFRTAATLPTEGLGGSTPILEAWLQNVDLLPPNTQTLSYYQPWLRLNETSVVPFHTVVGIMPPTLRATAFAGDISIIGDITLSPAPTGTIDLAASGSISALQVNGVTTLNGVETYSWDTSRINLSDANPDSIPGIASPYAFQTLAGITSGTARVTLPGMLTFTDNLFNETGSTQGASGVLQVKQALHAPGILHAGDAEPVHLYAGEGDISGVTLFSGKAARVIAGHDIADIELFVQNVASADTTLVAAGHDLIAYAPNSPYRVRAQSPGNALDVGASALGGDLQISGPGILEILTGRNLDLGVGPNNPDGTAVGITSIGNARNPYLPFAGASIIAGAGIGPALGLASSDLDFPAFRKLALDPAIGLPIVGKLLGIKDADADAITTAFNQLSAERQAALSLDLFYLLLRDAGRDHGDPASPGFGTYAGGFAAIDALFPGSEWKGDISLTSRGIKTKNGGDINLFAPGGTLTVGFEIAGSQASDQGILTETGGHISIFTHDDVIVGTSRIFTLRGGDEIIWSTVGDIAAGASSKTVQSAPPTRVLIDPQSGDVKTDLAGLATGGGIGVLASVKGVPPGDVDLIAPGGVIDAGDAGIRVSGNLNISAVQVLNASNIQAGGTTVGTPSVTVAAPNLGSLTAASNTAAATTSAATDATKKASAPPPPPEELPSIITVEVLGYGGGEAETP